MSQQQKTTLKENLSNFIRSEGGYTLITTAIVIVTIGFVVSALSTIYLIYQSQVKSTVSDHNITEIRKALDNYIALNGRLPCPAPMNANVDTPEIGLAVGSGGGCDSLAVFSGISSTTGRDGHRVQIGAVPTRSLNLPDSVGLDGWSKRLVYAVTANYTTAAANFKKNNGAITLKDGDKADGSPNYVTAAPGNAIYVLLAPGSDNRGAYNIDGDLLEACESGTFAGENCDFNNATFNLSLNRSFDVGSNTYTNTFFYTAGADIFKWQATYGACTCPTKTRPAIIQCLDADNNVVADTNCLSARPDDTPQDCSAETGLVGNCFGWFTPPWGACPCGTTGSRTSTCRQRSSNNGGFTSTTMQTLSCRREGDTEPQPNPEVRTCAACPPPPVVIGGDGGGNGGSTGDGSDPLIIDLNGDGIFQLTGINEGVMFDMDDDGILDETAWVSRDDGLLFIDDNGDGMVTNHSELFGNDDMQAFEELALHDSNGNGIIDEGDDNFGRIMVWQDANSDGISQASEMHSLSHHEITEIDLGHEEVEEELAGNRVTGQGTFTKMVNGTVQVVKNAIEFFFNFISGAEEEEEEEQ